MNDRRMQVGVIGAGAMGSGIAQVAATAGCRVLLFDVSERAVRASRTKLRKVMDRLIAKDKVSAAEAERIISNITYTVTADWSACDLVIEAIVEDLEIKKEVFANLENQVGPDCVIASNTSSLSITALAATLKKPERFIGMHFFNPAPLMKLVEVIPALQTDPEVARKARAWVDGWGKLTVVARDTPGFIVNKVARPFYGEALRLYEEGIADFVTIDWAMTNIGGFRMGPFTLMDFIGHDVNYAVTQTVFRAFHYDRRYAPSFAQKQLVEAGYYGRKAHRGFYDYGENAEHPAPKEDTILGKAIVQRIVAMLINEAADTLHYGIASKEDIETAMTKGVNYPKGLLHWADEIGIGECVRQMDALFDEYREERYRCSPLLRKMEVSQSSFFSNTKMH